MVSSTCNCVPRCETQTEIGFLHVILTIDRSLRCGDWVVLPVSAISSLGKRHFVHIHLDLHSCATGKTLELAYDYVGLVYVPNRRIVPFARSDWLL